MNRGGEGRTASSSIWIITAAPGTPEGSEYTVTVTAKVWYGGELVINVTNTAYRGSGYVGLDAIQSHWHYDRVEISN